MIGIEKLQIIANTIMLNPYETLKLRTLSFIPTRYDNGPNIIPEITIINHLFFIHDIE